MADREAAEKEHPALLCQPWARDRVLDLRMSQDQERRELRRAQLKKWITRSGWCCAGFTTSTIGVLMLCNISMMAAPLYEPPPALVLGFVSVAERVLFPAGFAAALISGLVLARVHQIAREESIDLDAAGGDALFSPADSRSSEA